MNGSSFPSGSRIAGSILLFAALFLGTLSFRLVTDGKKHLETGLELRDRGDLFRAVASFEDASRAYVPALPYPIRALRELELLAKGSLMRGDREEAAYIFEVIRRSVLSTRHFWQPNQAMLERTEKAIARLQSSSVPDLSVPGGPLETPVDPHPILALILVLGFLLWIGGGLALILVPNRPKSWRHSWALAATMVGLTSWLVMAWLAA